MTVEEGKGAYHTILVIIAVVAVLINSYFVTLFMRKKKLRTKSNWLLVSLAVIDLLTGGINMPLVIYLGIAEKLDMELIIMADVTSVCCAAITMLSLYSVVFNRFLSLCYPLKYTSWVTKRKIVTAIIFNWSVAIVVSYIRLWWLYPVFQGVPSPTERQDAIESDRIYYITGCCLYLLIITTLLLQFIGMFIVVRRLRDNEAACCSVSSQSESPHASVKREIKVVSVFAAMYFAFLICWTPLVVIRLLLRTGIKPPSIQVMDSLTVIRFLTSIIDPMLYTFFKYDTHMVALEDYKYISLKLTQCLERAGIKRPRSVSTPSGKTETDTFLMSLEDGREKTSYCSGLPKAADEFDSKV